MAGYMWDIVNWLISKLHPLLSPVTMFGLHPGVSAQSSRRSGSSAPLTQLGLQPGLCPLSPLFHVEANQDFQDSCNYHHSPATYFLDEGSGNSVNKAGFVVGLLFFSVVVVSFLWFFFFWEKNSGYTEWWNRESWCKLKFWCELNVLRVSCKTWFLLLLLLL